MNAQKTKFVKSRLKRRIQPLLSRGPPDLSSSKLQPEAPEAPARMGTASCVGLVFSRQARVGCTTTVQRCMILRSPGHHDSGSIQRHSFHLPKNRNDDHEPGIGNMKPPLSGHNGLAAFGDLKTWRSACRFERPSQSPEMTGCLCEYAICRSPQSLSKKLCL